MKSGVDIIQAKAKVAQQLVEAMKNPTEWRRTWSMLSSNRPHNPATGTVYKGANPIILAVSSYSRGFTDNRWLTKTKINELGLVLKPGQEKLPTTVFHGSMKYYVGNFFPPGQFKYTSLYLNTSPRINDTVLMTREVMEKLCKYKFKHPKDQAKIEAIYEKCADNPTSSLSNFIQEINHQFDLNLSFGSYRYKNKNKCFDLFNVDQLFYSPILDELKLEEHFPEFTPHERAENLIAETGVPIFHDMKDSNLYMPLKHEIHMTPKETFINSDYYYSALLHELGHATKGMENEKLHRSTFIEGTNEFCEEKYALEELHVELSSIMLCAELGINYDIDNHAAYLAGWASKIEKDGYKVVWDAFDKAEEIAAYLLTFDTLGQSKEKEISIDNDKDYNKIENTTLVSMEPIKQPDQTELKKENIPSKSKSSDNDKLVQKVGSLENNSDTETKTANIINLVIPKKDPNIPF